MRIETPAETFGRQVAETRGRKPGPKGWSQERLSEELKKLGVSIHSTAITKIERGDRKVSLDELFAISAALGVAPIHLLVPRGNEDQVQVAAEIEPRNAEVVRGWFQGEHPLWWGDATDEDDAFYFKEQPDEDWLVQQNAVYRQAKIMELIARRIAVTEATARGRAEEGQADRTKAWSEMLEELEIFNHAAKRALRKKGEG